MNFCICLCLPVVFVSVCMRLTTYCDRFCVFCVDVYVFVHLLPSGVSREPGDYQEGVVKRGSDGKDGDLDAVKYVEVEVEHHGPE